MGFADMMHRGYAPGYVEVRVRTRHSHGGSTCAEATLHGFAHTRSDTLPPTAMHQTLREINHNS